MTLAWQTPTYTGEVEAAWVDYNGHMRDAFYLLPMSHATDALMLRIGLDDAGRARTGHTLYTLEANLVYLSQLKQGDLIRVESRVIEADNKRARICHLMYGGAEPTLSAASEQLLINIDTASGRSTCFDAMVAEQVASACKAAAGEQWQRWLGRRIALQRPAES